jgi:cobalamin biosynthesis protein CobD/CbiB
MLPSETKVVDDYETTYHYLTSQCYKEIKKINKEDVDDLRDHLQEYASRMSELITELHLTWADFETAMQDESEEGSTETKSTAKS